MGAWKLIDDTGKCKGYLRLERNGQRVADFFPFAAGSDETWVRAQAQLILRTMNGEVGPVSGARNVDHD